MPDLVAEASVHGLASYRRGCRCDVCRAARSAYDRTRWSREDVRSRRRLGPTIDRNESCSIDGCGRNVYSRKGSPDGLCRHHHMAWRRYGDVHAGLAAMFADLIDDSAGPDGCWIWLGGKMPNGYGKFHSQYTHRLSYEFANGAIPAGMEIDHICHVRLCVNPRHLRPATSKQNKEHRQGARGDSSSGIRGVRKNTPNGRRWIARVRHNGQGFYLGTFDTAEEAAEVARVKRLELFTHNNEDRRG